VDVKGTDDPKLYFRARSFPHDGTEVLPGYLFPLPAGRYQVRLHFAEMSSKVRGERGSGIVIQGREVAREFDPLEKGFATAVVLEFPAEVKEGLLEVRFTRPPVKMPVVLNAIEIAKPE
jgi:hypothetical protein